MKRSAAFLFTLAGMWLMWGLGWVAAHQEVALECKRLSAFYVGDKVFSCAEINPQEVEQ